MNIGILVGGFPPEVLAGAELQVKQVSEQLTARGHQVTIFTRSFGFYPSRMEKDGYIVYPRRVLPVKGIRMIWDTGTTLWNIINSHPRPQVLLCYQTIINGLIGVLAQILLGIPCVVSIRGNEEYRLDKSNPYKYIVPLVYGAAKSIIVQTPGMMDDLLKQLQIAGKIELSENVHSKTQIIPNGVHLPKVNPRNRIKVTKVIYIGRLVPQKGVSDLIIAMKQLPKVDLIVVGDGPDRTRLESIANGASTTFVGHVSHAAVPNYLQQARVLVLPSHLGDGLPNVILEAMSWGVPVVSTYTAGIPDIVKHGETGYLCEPGDVGKIAAYIGCLLADDKLHHKLSVQSLNAVQSYSWNSVAPQIEQVLLKCLEDF